MSTPIKFDPSQGGIFRADKDAKPVGSPSSDKDFSKIMSKGEKPPGAMFGQKKAPTGKSFDAALAASAGSYTQESGEIADAEMTQMPTDTTLLSKQTSKPPVKAQVSLGREASEQVVKESPFDIYTQSSSKKQLKSLGLDAQSSDAGEELDAMAKRTSGFDPQSAAKKANQAMPQSSGNSDQSLAMNEKQRPVYEPQDFSKETSKAPQAKPLADSHFAAAKAATTPPPVVQPNTGPLLTAARPASIPPMEDPILKAIAPSNGPPVLDPLFAARAASTPQATPDDMIAMAPPHSAAAKPANKKKPSAAHARKPSHTEAAKQTHPAQHGHKAAASHVQHKAAPTHLAQDAEAIEHLSPNGDSPLVSSQTMQALEFSSEHQRQKEIQEALGSLASAAQLAANTPMPDISELPGEVIAVATPTPNPLFSQEQPDMSFFNPMTMAPTALNVVAGTAAEQPLSSAAQIQEVIDQIVNKIYTIKVEGQTDTVITLKHPPLFEGATLTLKTYDTAKGEFNITFEHLCPEAKQLLDMQEHQKSLKLALEQKGYAVHIITVSTGSENAMPIYDEPQQRSAGGEQKEDEESKRRFAREEQNEDETNA